MVNKQLNQSLDDIIKQQRIRKIHTNQEIITTKRPSQEQNFNIRRKIITKPQIYTRKSPSPQIAQIPAKKYYTSATKSPVKKNTKQIFTEKYYKEQLALQQQKEQEELAENEARQERIQQISLKAKYNYNRIKIENLYHSIDHQELRELFEAWGELVKLGIVWDDLGYSTGVAYVEYSTEEGAKKAIQEYDKAELDGLILKVSYE